MWRLDDAKEKEKISGKEVKFLYNKLLVKSMFKTLENEIFNKL